MWDFAQLQMAEATVTFQPDDVIITEGEVGNVMYVILEGRVRITVQGHPIDQLETGDFFGEMALVDEKPRSATATALSACRLLVIDKTRFPVLVQQLPDFSYHILNIMSTRIRRFMREEVRRQRMEEELAIGRQIQLSLLPEEAPRFSGWQIAAFYRPAREVGGDLYDFVVSPGHPEQLNIVVADVTGKGVPAALFMAMSRTFMRAEIMNGQSPAGILQRANDFLRRERSSQLFLTAIVGRLDTKTGWLTFAGGGHDPPLWYQAAAQQAVFLEAPGFLLGAFEDPRAEEKRVQLAAGDALVFYTDGITEARNPAGVFFGEERLQAVVPAGPGQTAEGLVQQIVGAVEAFAGDVPQSDDLTLVVVRREGS